MADETASPDLHRLSDEDHQRIFDTRIVPHLFADARSVDRPIAVIFGGQPGAGKSDAVGRALDELSRHGGAVAIVGDDFRAYHPRYAQLQRADDKTAAFYTDRDTAAWVEKSIALAAQRRTHVVIEGTMRDPAKVAATLVRMRAAGFQTQARVLAVPARLSALGILERYEVQRREYGQGRLTLPKAHQAALDGMPKTVERIERDQLADRIVIERRDGSPVYDNQLVDDRWRDPPRAPQALQDEQNRVLTPNDYKQIAEGYALVAALMQERNAPHIERQAVAAEHNRATVELRDAQATDRGPALDR